MDDVVSTGVPSVKIVGPPPRRCRLRRYVASVKQFYQFINFINQNHMAYFRKRIIADTMELGLNTGT